MCGRGRPAARVGVKVRFVPFITRTRSATLAEPTSDTATIEATVLDMLDQFTAPAARPVGRGPGGARHH